MGDGVKPDARQLRIVDVLKERSPKLAGAYQMALENLHRTAIDDCASARVSVVCHCMRELMIGLPAVMADDPEPRPDPSSNSLTQQLPELLAKHPDLDLGVDQDIVPVPKAVAQILNSAPRPVRRWWPGSGCAPDAPARARVRRPWSPTRSAPPAPSAR